MFGLGATAATIGMLVAGKKFDEIQANKRNKKGTEEYTVRSDPTVQGRPVTPKDTTSSDNGNLRTIGGSKDFIEKDSDNSSEEEIDEESVESKDLDNRLRLTKTNKLNVSSGSEEGAVFPGPTIRERPEITGGASTNNEVIDSYTTEVGKESDAMLDNLLIADSEDDLNDIDKMICKALKANELLLLNGKFYNNKGEGIDNLPKEGPNLSLTVHVFDTNNASKKLIKTIVWGNIRYAYFYADSGLLGDDEDKGNKEIHEKSITALQRLLNELNERGYRFFVKTKEENFYSSFKLENNIAKFRKTGEKEDLNKVLSCIKTNDKDLKPDDWYNYEKGFDELLTSCENIIKSPGASIEVLRQIQSFFEAFNNKLQNNNLEKNIYGNIKKLNAIKNAMNNKKKELEESLKKLQVTNEADKSKQEKEIKDINCGLKKYKDRILQVGQSCKSLNNLAGKTKSIDNIIKDCEENINKAQQNIDLEKLNDNELEGRKKEIEQGLEKCKKMLKTQESLTKYAKSGKNNQDEFLENCKTAIDSFQGNGDISWLRKVTKLIKRPQKAIARMSIYNLQEQLKEIKNEQAKRENLLKKKSDNEQILNNSDTMLNNTEPLNLRDLEPEKGVSDTKQYTTEQIEAKEKKCEALREELKELQELSDELNRCKLEVNKKLESLSNVLDETDVFDENTPGSAIRFCQIKAINIANDLLNDYQKALNWIWNDNNNKENHYKKNLDQLLGPDAFEEESGIAESSEAELSMSYLVDDDKNDFFEESEAPRTIDEEESGSSVESLIQEAGKNIQQYKECLNGWKPGGEDCNSKDKLNKEEFEKVKDCLAEIGDMQEKYYNEPSGILRGIPELIEAINNKLVDDVKIKNLKSEIVQKEDKIKSIKGDYSKSYRGFDLIMDIEKVENGGNYGFFEGDGKKIYWCIKNWQEKCTTFEKRLKKVDDEKNEICNILKFLKAPLTSNYFDEDDIIQEKFEEVNQLQKEYSELDEKTEYTETFVRKAKKSQLGEDTTEEEKILEQVRPKIMELSDKLYSAEAELSILLEQREKAKEKYKTPAEETNEEAVARYEKHFDESVAKELTLKKALKYANKNAEKFKQLFYLYIDAAWATNGLETISNIHNSINILVKCSEQILGKLTQDYTDIKFDKTINNIPNQLFDNVRHELNRIINDKK